MADESKTLAADYRPELPDWGVYLNWPVEGTAWIHPDDVEMALKLIPSKRVFRRYKWDGEYYWLNYGEVSLRVAPTMWVNVPAVDLELEQQVELLSRDGSNDPGIFRISDIMYAPEKHEIEYFLKHDSLVQEESFTREDLRPLHVKHELRSGFYEHQKPKSNLPEDVDLLDVGNLTDE